MRADELYLHCLEFIGNTHDQPIFVATDIENQAIIGDKIDRRAELGFDIGGTGPVRLCDDSVPSPQRLLSLGLLLFPE